MRDLDPEGRGYGGLDVSDYLHEFSTPVKVWSFLVLPKVHGDFDGVVKVRSPRWLVRWDLDNQLHGPFDE